MLGYRVGCRKLLLLLLSVSTLPGQAPPGDKAGSIRGQVLNLAGEPLRKAEVVLRGSGPNRGGEMRAAAATTDSSGVFAFENLPPGNYVISAQRNGYVRPENGRRTTGGMNPGMQGVTVAAGQNVTGLSMKLTPHSVVTGKITDEDGEPMYGANVQVMEERFFRGRRVLTGRANGVVNDLGEYRVAGLQPGRYFLSVDPRPNRGPMAVAQLVAGQESERNFVPTFYPGVVEQSQAAPISLQPGQEARGIDMQVRKWPTAHVRGQIVDENGAPVTNTVVMVLNRDSPSNTLGRSGPVQPNGTFDISGVTPGSHTLMANRMTRDRGRSVAILPVQVGARDLDNVVLRMSPPAEVRGVIRAEDNPPLPNVRVTLDPIEGIPFDMQSSRAIGEGNTFHIPNVTPGSYRVTAVGAPDGYYLKSVQIGGQDISSSGVSVTGSVSGLEVIFAKGAVGLEGTVAGPDSALIGQAVITLVPPADKRTYWSLFKNTTADQNGKFAFRNLSPGEYTLLALPPGEDPAVVQNPDFLNTIESKATLVKLGASASESVQLKVIE